ncbi:chemotaxis protein CheW [Mesoterricola silvestris]|uniref:Chemotaxis protein CheW n=1 Tax=Mesoterricola silvestris TaxID=2927979 RepID=A0AA48KB67_9BACT|nr:chemotaxis protein CheW [Mesoterricola silvestris]BDU72218.1 chemotaxis protein CheW [Mesoterricola silvestris]
MTQPMTVNRRASAPVHGQASRQYLAFVLDGETYAMEIRSIKEVIQYGALTRVPMMPAFIRGVINLRGAVVPVLDLAVRFGRGAREPSRRTCVVVLEVDHPGGALALGFLVDQVRAVLDIAAADIEPPPAFGGSLRSDFLEGIGKVDGEFMILLDVDRVLSVEELSEISA